MLARIRWCGQEFLARPISNRPDQQSWTMEALAHTARCVPGTIIEVKYHEILQQGIPEDGPAAVEVDRSRQELEKAMAAERETLPAPKQLLANAGAMPGHDDPAKGVSVTPGPT